MQSDVISDTGGAYLPVLVFFIIVVGLASLLAFLPLVLSSKRKNKAKVLEYECGFRALSKEKSISRFDIRFYLVSILFIIFDLEIAFLFPWAISFDSIGVVGFYSMMVFLLVLTVGFIYEWKKGALEWD